MLLLRFLSIPIRFVSETELVDNFGFRQGHARKLLYHLRQARSSADVEVAVNSAKSQGAHAMIKLMESRPFELQLQREVAEDVLEVSGLQAHKLIQVYTTTDCCLPLVSLGS
jgi:hypothetical protein